MISRGSIFYALRSKMLFFYPDKCKLKRERETFSDWLMRGVYNPVPLSSNEIIIEASPEEIGSILLSDIEYYSNNCFEHIQEILCCSIDERIRSDAWNIVNIYYFVFFVGHALLRLLGKPIIFIRKEAIHFLKGLLGPNIPGPGTYSLEKIKNISETVSQYRLKKNKGKLHEATWKELFNILESIMNDKTLIIDGRELLFYKAITTKKLFKIYGSYAWPSDIRNLANYVPGYAYCMVENQIKGKSKKLIINWNNCSAADMMRNLNLSIGLDEKEYANNVSLMHDIAHSLFILFRELYFELINRRHIDKRMEFKRKQFIKKMAMKENIRYYFAKTI